MEVIYRGQKFKVVGRDFAYPDILLLKGKKRILRVSKKRTKEVIDEQ